MSKVNLFLQLVKKIELKKISVSSRRKQLPTHRLPSFYLGLCVGGFFNPLCFLSGSALKEFEQVPRHLTDELHLFSLEDLLRVKKGLLVPSLKDVLKATLTHVAHCEVRFRRGQMCP